MEEKPDWRSESYAKAFEAHDRADFAQEFLREVRTVVCFKGFGVTLRTPVGLLLHHSSPVRFFGVGRSC